ncbi:MAG: diacylglycerol kinase family lipid kinase [Flavobacteriales bacterium]|nr:diacylglycerol kinase family lipid kinase [Flavobacteriales bacterium]
MHTKRDSFYVIFNPRSGGVKSPSDREGVFDVFRKQQVDFTFEEQDDTDAFGKTRRAIEKGFRKFIVMGGDGTLNQTVNALFQQSEVHTEEFTICMIPFGSGNDWIRTLGIPRKPTEAADIISTGKIFTQDIGKVEYSGKQGRESVYFANIAGFAYDAFVNRKTLEDPLKKWLGGLSYQLTMFKCLLSFQHVQAKITVDDTVIETPLFSGCVAKCKYNGNGMMQAPHAIPDDGLLAVTLIKDISKPGIVLETKNLGKGTFTKNKHIQILKGKRVSVETTPEIELECEGEQYGKSPFVFEVLPKALKVIVPSGIG